MANQYRTVQQIHRALVAAGVVRQQDGSLFTQNGRRFTSCAEQVCHGTFDIDPLHGVYDALHIERPPYWEWRAGDVALAPAVATWVDDHAARYVEAARMTPYSMPPQASPPGDSGGWGPNVRGMGYAYLSLGIAAVVVGVVVWKKRGRR